MFLTRSNVSTRAAVDQEAGRWLGWVSIAIGLTEIFAPRQLKETIGVGTDQTTGILRVLGLREIMHGVDIVTHNDPTPGVWSRVWGDVLDGVLLGLAATRTKNPKGLATVAAVVTPIVLADMIPAPRLSKDSAAGRINT